MMDKKEQKKLLIEIMQEDEKDGLYESTLSKKETVQTAVDFLYEYVQMKLPYEQSIQFEGLFQQAKQMEKEQIIEAYCMGDDNIGAEQYYNKTYNK